MLRAALQNSYTQTAICSKFSSYLRSPARSHCQYRCIAMRRPRRPGATRTSRIRVVEECATRHLPYIAIASGQGDGASAFRTPICFRGSNLPLPRGLTTGCTTRSHCGTSLHSGFTGLERPKTRLRWRAKHARRRPSHWSQRSRDTTRTFHDGEEGSFPGTRRTPTRPGQIMKARNNRTIEAKLRMHIPTSSQGKYALSIVASMSICESRKRLRAHTYVGREERIKRQAWSSLRSSQNAKVSSPLPTTPHDQAAV